MADVGFYFCGKCECATELKEANGRCGECHGEFAPIPDGYWKQYYSFPYVHFGHSRESSLLKRERQGWKWWIEGGILYLSCSKCKSIIPCHKIRVSKDGYVQYENAKTIRYGPQCVVCPECKAHLWGYLENWKGR